LYLNNKVARILSYFYRFKLCINQTGDFYICFIYHHRHHHLQNCLHYQIILRYLLAEVFTCSLLFNIMFYVLIFEELRVVFFIISVESHNQKKNLDKLLPRG